MNIGWIIPKLASVEREKRERTNEKKTLFFLFVLLRSQGSIKWVVRKVLLNEY